MELNGLQVLEGGCHQMTDLPVPKSRLLWDGVVGVVEGRALPDGGVSAGVRMLRDELLAVESRVLSDGVASGGVRLL